MTEKRETSIEAYHKVKETGMLSTLRLAVFEILCKHGPMTAGEMRNYGGADMNSGVYGTRLSELERMGVVQELETRKCSTTGHRAIVWGITHEMPVKLEKKVSRKERRENILEAITTHGKKEIPIMPEELETYKNELRDIYIMVRDL